ncbi:MAG: ketopantoate reductase family protein, partial [Alphaproteobacteria bacterium]
ANVLEAALGPKTERKDFIASAQAEAEAVYRQAGITWNPVGQGASDPRREELMQMQPVAGAMRFGGSSTQSLQRGTPAIETDYLNGEIVLLGRLHGVPTPVNAALVALGQRLIAERLSPGELSRDDVAAALGQP